MDQIEPLHRRQTPIDLVSPITAANNCGIKLPADHRGRLEERAVILREAVDASGQQALHARREGCRNRARVKVQFAACGAYDTPLREEADNLLSEEWIALSLLSHLPRERLGESIDPKSRSVSVGECRRSAAAPGASLVTTARSSQGGEYSGRRDVRSSSLSLASLSTILPSTSSDTLSIQCKSSMIMTTGESRQRASSSCCKSSRVRRPISTPSSPVNAPSGTAETKQVEQQAEITSRMQAECGQSHFQLLRNFFLRLARADPERPRTTSMKGRNGVCWPSGEQLPDRMKARSLSMR